MMRITSFLERSLILNLWFWMLVLTGGILWDRSGRLE